MQDVDELIEADQAELDEYMDDEFIPDDENASGVDLDALQAGKNWERPTPIPIDPAKDDLIFQQVELDYTIQKPNPIYDKSQCREVPVVRIYGVTKEGNSVTAFVHGFEPYFFIEAPSESFGYDGIPPTNLLPIHALSPGSPPSSASHQRPRRTAPPQSRRV